MLYYCGRIHRMRDVRGGDGGATMDFDPIEERRGITISSAATYVDWEDYRYHIIDTPGHVDFTVEVERSLRVLDGAVMVLCSVGGVQSQTITVDRQMRRYDVPRIALINKMDRIGANPQRVIDQLNDRLAANPIALQIPIGMESDFVGVVDLVTMQAVYFDGDDGGVVRRESIPDTLIESASSARALMLESLAMYDEALMATVAADKEPSVDHMRRVIRDATLSREITPVLMGSAYKNVGVQEVLNAIMHYLPAPCERKVSANELSQLAENEEQRTVTLTSHADAPVVAMAFKTVVEKFGQLTFLRVYQGQIGKGDVLKNARTGKSMRIGRLVRVHSNKHEDIAVARPGEIVAVVGVDCASGDTFTDRKINVALENIVVAPPVVKRSIAPEKREDMDKLGKSLERFRRQDPTFHVFGDADTGETIIAGMGELHLEVYVERLRDECKCPCIVGRPTVTYRERPTRGVVFDHKFQKQNGGQGMFAHILGHMELLPPSAGERFVFENQITGGKISRSFINAARDGFAEALTVGPLDGYEMVGVKVILQDGREHDKDSNELAFRLCAQEAMRQAIMPKCGAELLEPVMKLDLEFPSEFQGAVSGHLARHRGTVVGSETNGPLCTLQVHAPLAELFDFANHLRSMTQGNGSFTMQPHGYQSVPLSVQKSLLGK